MLVYCSISRPSSVQLLSTALSPSGHSVSTSGDRRGGDWACSPRCWSLNCVSVLVFGLTSEISPGLPPNSFCHIDYTGSRANCKAFSVARSQREGPSVQSIIHILNGVGAITHFMLAWVPGMLLITVNTNLIGQIGKNGYNVQGAFKHR